VKAVKKKNSIRDTKTRLEINEAAHVIRKFSKYTRNKKKTEIIKTRLNIE
jgi:hypothetical protein